MGPDQLKCRTSSATTWLTASGSAPSGVGRTQPFGSHVAGSRVHRRALDPGGADIDAKNLHSRPPVAALSRMHTYWAVQPPSMTSSLPVTNDDSSLAR